MGGIKYYQLAKGEEMPDEFCAVRDVGGEPSEYVFYAPNAENTKLQEFATEIWELLTCNEPVFVWEGLREKAHKLGVEMEE